MSDTTITVYVRTEDEAPYNLTVDTDEAYAEVLDELYGTVTIAGSEYDTGRALREVDPIAFRVGASDYFGDEEWRELEMPLDVYLGDEGERDGWVARELGHELPDEDDDED